MVRWGGAATIGLLPLAAAAQQTIQFTKPVDEDLSGKPSVVQPANPHRLSAGAFNAPTPLFGNQAPSASFDILPGASDPRVISTANSAQWQKFLDNKKNWTLLTPEEILNVPTPEKILGITDPKDDPKLSAEERFLQRQDRLAAEVTNALHRLDTANWRDDSATTDPFHSADASSRFAGTLGGAVPSSADRLNPFFNNLNPNALANAGQRPDSPWASPFGQPAQLPKQTPEQLAGMDRFRALMEPSVPEKAPEPVRASYRPATTPDPNLQVLPAYNPVGYSFKALENNSSKPKGLTPLPGITGQRPPAKKPASLVQPPPWLSDTPQAFTPLQRQF